MDFEGALADLHHCKTPKLFAPDRDLYECEREAIFAGAGNKQQAFDNCMKARGCYISSRIQLIGDVIVCDSYSKE